MCDVVRNTWRWIDDTTSYYTTVLNPIRYDLFLNYYRGVCSSIHVNNVGKFYATSCFSYACDEFMCEKRIQNRNLSYEHSAGRLELKNTLQVLNRRNSTFVDCPSGHVTHDFLSCDVDSHCGVDKYSAYCALPNSADFGSNRNPPHTGGEDLFTVKMFHCHARGGTIPYTLVCDYRNDCADNSDEIFCQHKEETGAFR